jgi:selenocysteine lyase/cysteine desulfurase
MRPHGDPEHLDFIAFSAHKMYAPYGIGALVGDHDALLAAEPETVGGGTVDIVTLDSVYWRDLPDREEAGTPDIVGCVALAAIIRLIEQIGWDVIIEHEERLTRYTLERLSRIPGVTVYGRVGGESLDDRLGVIAFNVEGHDHALVAAILSYEGAVGVRNGCFCAHPYMLCLLNVPEDEAVKVRDEIISRDRSHIPGAVRASIGIYNDQSDIDALGDSLEMIAGRRYKGRYSVCRESGAYVPDGEDCFVFEHHFTLDPRLP